VSERSLLFKCSKCGWWAMGTHHAEETVERDGLNDAQFDVKCTSEDCGWTAQLTGNQAHKNSSDTKLPA
jgi:hypothetical protein